MVKTLLYFVVVKIKQQIWDQFEAIFKFTAV